MITPRDFRELFQLLQSEPTDLTVLHIGRQLLDPLRFYGEWSAAFLPVDDIQDDVWELYALSRVNEFLLYNLQPGWPMTNTNGLAYSSFPTLSREEYVQRFVLEWELQVVEHPVYHPFYHEIVQVEEARDINAPITLVAELWPCVMMDSLLISRAGVVVRAGRALLDPDIVRRTLFFAYMRRYRPVSDRSHGWGSNSQWRTDFRRDYISPLAYHYNVDGRYDLTNPDRPILPAEAENVAPLNRSERIDLLINRYLNSNEYSDGDVWPFYDSLVQRKEA